MTNKVCWLSSCKLLLTKLGFTDKEAWHCKMVTLLFTKLSWCSCIDCSYHKVLVTYHLYIDTSCDITQFEEFYTNRWTSSVHENLLYLTLKMHSVSLHDGWYYISRFKMQPVDNLLDNNTHAAQSCGMMYDFSRVTYFPIG